MGAGRTTIGFRVVIDYARVGAAIGLAILREEGSDASKDDRNFVSCHDVSSMINLSGGLAAMVVG
jgi:hypothetical protein